MKHNLRAIWCTKVDLYMRVLELSCPVIGSNLSSLAKRCSQLVAQLRVPGRWGAATCWLCRAVNKALMHLIPDTICLVDIWRRDQKNGRKCKLKFAQKCGAPTLHCVGCRWVRACGVCRPARAGARPRLAAAGSDEHAGPSADENKLRWICGL